MRRIAGTLAVVLLAAGVVLIFVGTLAQVHEGLYNAQVRYFKSWVIVGVTLFSTKMPWLILPGGYTIGALLLANLTAAHFTRFHWTWRKSGIFMTHLGLILLLLGQLGTDLLSTESAMRLEEGETKNYSEDFHANELVFINKSLPNEDEVIAIPEKFIAAKQPITHPQLPFTVKVNQSTSVVTGKLKSEAPVQPVPLHAVPEVSFGSQTSGASEVAAVVPVHTHFDHAMDSAVVAQRTGATRVGGESTANVGRGGGLPADRIRVVGDGEVDPLDATQRHGFLHDDAGLHDLNDLLRTSDAKRYMVYGAMGVNDAGQIAATVSREHFDHLCGLLAILAGFGLFEHLIKFPL